MYKASFGYEFDTKEKVNEFNNGAFVCYSGCKNKDEVWGDCCNECCLINECIKAYQDMENNKVIRSDNMLNLTKKQMEVIGDNLKAYKSNFDYIVIEKEDYGKGFYVYTSQDRKEQGSWTQYCYNIDYLNGWLYGCVQAINGVMKPIDKE